MTSLSHVVTLSPRDYDAVLFDLDGVLTKTASVHAAAWKRMFDEFLQKRAARTGVSLVPFDIQEDYPPLCRRQTSLRWGRGLPAIAWH